MALVFGTSRFQNVRLTVATRNVLLLSFCGVLALATTGIMWGTDIAPLPKYVIGLVLFGIMTATFIASRIQKGVWPLFEYPVTISVLAFIQFGLAPLYLFFSHPDDLPPLVTDTAIIDAFPLCVLGMVAFWAGTTFVRRRVYTRPQFSVATVSKDSPRLLAWSIGMFAIGMAVQLTMVAFRYNVALDTAQFVIVVGESAILALIVVAIEINSSARKGWFKVLFWIMLAANCVVAFFSAMKGAVLVNVAVVTIVAWICTQRAPRKWLVSIVCALILIYPIVNSMRLNQISYNIQAHDVDSAITTGREAVTHADQGEGLVGSGIRSSVIRLEILSSVVAIKGFGPAAEFIDSGDRIWMIPFYPFVPRLIWKDKPIANEGARFSVLLGGSDATSIAITYVGDAFLRGGTPGVIVGMLLWGVLAEALVQFLYRDFTKRRLLVYMGVTFMATASPLESTVFLAWCGVLKQFVIISAFAYLIYGRGKPGRAKRRLAVQPVLSGSRFSVES